MYLGLNWPIFTYKSIYMFTASREQKRPKSKPYGESKTSIRSQSRRVGPRRKPLSCQELILKFVAFRMSPFLLPDVSHFLASDEAGDGARRGRRPKTRMAVFSVPLFCPRTRRRAADQPPDPSEELADPDGTKARRNRSSRIPASRSSGLRRTPSVYALNASSA
jgi:hypothetical protein